MSFRVDHIIRYVYDLDAGIAGAQGQGFNAFYGGVHAAGTTHNALICFADGSYDELMTLTGRAAQPTAAMDFAWLLRDKPEGVVGWAIAARDIDAEAAALRASGVPVGAITEGQRRRADGEVLRWRLAWIDLRLPTILIQDVTPRRLRVSDDPAVTAQPNGMTGIAALILPEALEDTGHFAALFGAPTQRPDGTRRYALEGSDLIVSPAADAPVVVYASSGAG
ncbi:MAG: VOC family protein [Anaerolineae bacterium]|nr:VOC family protein [Anaerolineae bacterium]NUQ05745.1 VOC family protein [Anaerolineae bacterium]